MTIYLSILRVINVSGQRLIQMEVLRKSYESLGYTRVPTYIQSGNVVFSAEDRSPEELALDISRQIREDTGFRVPVIVLTREELRKAEKGNPFTREPALDPAFMHITFLSSDPSPFDPNKIVEKKVAGEEIAFHGQTVYLYCPDGYGRTKLSNTFLESKLKVTATTRNWKTVNELLKIAELI